MGDWTVNERDMYEKDSIEIDLGRIGRTLLKKSWLMAAVSVACAVIVLGISILFMTPRYQSSAMFYVNNSALAAEEATQRISTSDISASRGLVQSYIVILNTRESLNDIIDYSGISKTHEEVKEMISARVVDNTEFFEVVVTSPDPQEAEQIADAIAQVLPQRIAAIIEGTSAKIADAAVLPSRPSSPDYLQNTLIGFLLGFVVSAGMIILKTALDGTIHTEEDILQNCSYPVLASVPDMEHVTEGGYAYLPVAERKKKRLQAGKKAVFFGNEISFSAAEAYKLLRTKLQFSFADDSDSRIIGISSSISGEGKSLSAINLAFSLSQLGKKVLLIDCDMRCSVLAQTLKLQKQPGLSNFLTGQSPLNRLLQPCGIPEDEKAFYVMTAGTNPPNPVELLSSARMSRLLTELRKTFDYVILDFPPVGEVSDAIAAAKETDGILLVVRQDQCSRMALGNAVRQFEYVGAKLLGIVYNCTRESHRRKYGRQ